MHVAAVQFDIVWEDKPANHHIIEEMLADAKLPAGTFVLLPELGDTGFSFNLDRTVDDRTLPWAQSLARKHDIFVQAGYAARGPDGKGRNCTAVVSPAGHVLGEYRKVHPFSFGREAQHFTGGDSLLVTQCNDATVCPVICYDLRFPELFRMGALHDALMFTIGANWPAARQHHWRTLLIARAIENQAIILACNRTGHDPHLSYAGGSMIVGPKGDVLAEAGDQSQVLHAEIDCGAAAEWRREFPALADIRRTLLGDIPMARTGAAGDCT